MKVLTLHQPWASLVALGLKTIETRSWSTQYRGPLAIHAGLRYQTLHLDIDPDDRGRLWSSGSQMLIEPKVGNEATWKHGNPFHRCPLGAIVATCTLVDVVPIRERQWPEPEGLTRPYLTVHPDGSRLLKWQRHQSKVGLNVTDQLPYGDFTPGRYAWLLADIVPVDPPVLFRGGQGLTKTWEPT